jgi:hypothetical protein
LHIRVSDLGDTPPKTYHHEVFLGKLNDKIPTASAPGRSYRPDELNGSKQQSGESILNTALESICSCISQSHIIFIFRSGIGDATATTWSIILQILEAPSRRSICMSSSSGFVCTRWAAWRCRTRPSRPGHTNAIVVRDAGEAIHTSWPNAHQNIPGSFNLLATRTQEVYTGCEAADIHHDNLATTTISISRGCSATR